MCLGCASFWDCIFFIKVWFERDPGQIAFVDAVVVITLGDMCLGLHARCGWSLGATDMFQVLSPFEPKEEIFESFPARPFL